MKRVLPLFLNASLALGVISSPVFAYRPDAPTTGKETKAEFTLPSGVAVEIVEAPYVHSEPVPSACKTTSFGCPTDLDYTTYVKSLRVTYKGVTYSLDASKMYDAWGSRPLEIKGVIRYFGGWCTDTKNCAFRGLFADGCDAFVAEWVIWQGVPRRTDMTTSSEVIHEFMKQIDPPKSDLKAP